MMATAAVIYWLERFGNSSSPQAASDEQQAASNPFAGLWRRFSATPLAVPTLVYVLVFLLATALSVVPRVSFWGSYQRLQGTYTNLSYVLLFVLIIGFMRRREQLERLVSVVLCAGLAVASYGLLQHFQLDPLPWRGDVITRVASSLGNSIFVAAYLIMVIPFGLYRIFAAIPALRDAERTPPKTDLLWAVAYGLLIVGSLLLILSILAFSVAVRVADSRYWWIFPGSIMTATALWVLPSLGLSRSERLPFGLNLAAIVSFLYVAFFLISYGISGSMGGQVVDPNAKLNWGLLLSVACLAIISFFVLAYTLPRRNVEQSRTSLQLQIAGGSIVVLASLLAIFFSQSRGPWLGGGASLVVFFTLLLWWAARQARLRDALQLAKRLQLLLWSWVGLAVIAGGFLIAFNTIDTPAFVQLREVPYIGRMGKLLETDAGTGLVRRLIWTGDEFGSGTIGLITADPVRTVIGWGPESMFVAYNPFYPPALANIESRGASPDRSHQAILDELVNKGVLGLLSYLFVLVSFSMLCWKMLFRAKEWYWQVFFIACFSVMIAHFVEGMAGIPIVATLMMLWVTMGLAVVAGSLAGGYVLGADPAAKAEEAAVEEAPAVAAQPAPSTGKGGRNRNQQRGAVARGAASARGSRRQQQSNPASLLVYALICIVGFGAIWWTNLNPVYADMRFQEGQSYINASNSGWTEQIYGIDRMLDAIRRDPDEDYYYLNLGRVMMSLADVRRSQGEALTPPEGNIQLNNLIQLDTPEKIQQFILAKTPLTLMAYAEAVLTRAYDLNQMNKDHSANLGRLNNFWYNWTQEPERLQKALEWFQNATRLAPQDVSIANEEASVLSTLGSVALQQADQAKADEYYAQAEQILARSRLLDPKYKDTDARLADLLRLQKRYAEASELYVSVIAANPHQLDSMIERIAMDYRDNNQQELLKTLVQAYASALEANPSDGLLASITGLVAVRAGDAETSVKAYGTAVASAPQRLDYLRNYTLVLSDTRRYEEAITYAQQAITIAQQQVQAGMTDQEEVTLLQSLLAFLKEQQAAGS
jgi:tetratricopeptide (TPR) repeat protein